MKYYSILIFLFISMSATSQPTYFNKIIVPQPFNGANTVLSMVKRDSLIYVYGGNLPDTGWIQNNSMLQFNLAGQLLNKTLISIPNNFTSTNPVTSLIDDGTGLVAIGMLIDTANTKRGFMVKTNYNLDTLWTRIYPHPNSDSIPFSSGLSTYNHFDVIRKTPDGGYIVAGRYNPLYNNTGLTSTFLLKTNNMGQKEWLRTYPDADLTISLEITHDGGFVFTSFRNGLHLLRTDSLGNLLWKTKMPQELRLEGNSVKQFANGDFAIVAYYVYDNPMTGLYLYGINLIRVSSSGDIVKRWNKHFTPYKTIQCLPLNQWLDLKILDDQSMVIMGNARVFKPELNDGAQYKGFIMKVGPTGDSLWARYYNYGKFEDWSQLYAMVQTDDGGFLAGGWQIEFDQAPTTNARIWLIKVDSMGCETPGCHLIGIEERVLSIQELEVFPNPFSEQMYVVLPEGYSGGKLVMYDVQGKKAMETEVPVNWGQQNFVLETNLMNPGIYLVELTDRDGRVWRRKAVKK